MKQKEEKKEAPKENPEEAKEAKKLEKKEKEVEAAAARTLTAGAKGSLARQETRALRQQKVEEAQKPNVWITKERFQLELVATAKITVGPVKLSAPKSPSRTSVRQSAGMQVPHEL